MVVYVSREQTSVNMVLLTTKFVQRASLFVSFGGLVTTIITTFLPLWKTMNSDLNEMENWYEGLWHMCIYTEEVGIHCKAFESFLALPLDTLASRVLMCISIATGFLGVAAAFFGLQGVEIGTGRERMKRTLLILGGVFIVVSGITTLAPVSLMAYIMVVKFWDENLPDVMPRWEYGEAMFSAWFAGLLLVVGGTFLFVAVCMGDHEAKLQSKILARNQEQRSRTQHYRKTEII
uniref:Claudin n=2 Tax=Sinocyclocheilus rhinocerous TaxID=307959 RepID=A0A673NPS5_9TELE